MNAETIHDPTSPKIDRVRSACVCPVRAPRYEGVTERRDPDRPREAVAPVVQLESEEHVREAGDEGRPETHEVPHGPPPVERDDPRVAGRVVVLDRLVERLALEGKILTQVFDVVSDLVEVVRPSGTRAHPRLLFR